MFQLLILCLHSGNEVGVGACPVHLLFELHVELFVNLLDRFFHVLHLALQYCHLLAQLVDLLFEVKVLLEEGFDVSG